MKPFLMWLILGALLFLCSCGQKQYSVHAYRLYTMNHRTENPSDAAEPAIPDSGTIATSCNDDFGLPFHEYLVAFHARAYDMSPLRETALRTERSY